MREAWRNRIVSTGTKPAIEFMANTLNWRVHPKAQRNALNGVLSEVGWVTGVVENVRTGNLIDGHARIEEALKLGDDTPVPYIDVDLSEEEERLILASLDPLSAMAAADKAQLDSLLQSVQTQDAAVQQMLADLAKASGLDYGAKQEAPDAPIDKADELQAKWQVKPGDLWRIGEHRLICGDCTDKAVVERLMQGEKARFEFSDPPYQVETQGGGVMRQSGHLQKITDAGIDSFDPSLLFEVARTSVYCCNRPLLKQYMMLADSWSRAWDLCFWKKNNTPPNYGGHLMTDVEYLFVVGEQSPISGQDKELYSKAFTSDIVAERVVGWQKPVPLVAKFINLFSVRDDVVFDRYCGSGTTLVACEQLHRKGRGVEIEPKYCAVTLERLSLMGLTPELVIQVEAS